MTNKRFLTGMLAVALVFGVILAGCDTGSGDSGGGVPSTQCKLTITGISAYDGKYAIGQKEEEGVFFLKATGDTTINSDLFINGGQLISGGQVVLWAYKMGDDGKLEPFIWYNQYILNIQIIDPARYLSEEGASLIIAESYSFIASFDENGNATVDSLSIYSYL
jgi:hypothetical protein